jgi:hypothetical protein
MLQAGASPISGKGLFATEPAEPGTKILSFWEGSEGPMGGLALEWKYPPVPLRSLPGVPTSADALQCGPDAFLALAEPAVLVNHSCDPNCGINGDLLLVALRQIDPGEELTWDYSTTMDHDSWTMRCQCGAMFCRHVVREYRSLPRPVAERYAQALVVPDYCARHFGWPGWPAKKVSQGLDSA